MKKLLFFLFMACVTLMSAQTFGNHDAVEAEEPVVVFDYLVVYPKSLGYYSRQTFPVGLIERYNSEGKYGYHTWRLPTKNELALLLNCEELNLKADFSRRADGTPYYPFWYQKNLFGRTVKKKHKKTSYSYLLLVADKN